METTVNVIAGIMALVTTLTEVALVLTTLWRISVLEKRVAALEKESKEQPTVTKIANEIAKNLSNVNDIIFH